MTKLEELIEFNPDAELNCPNGFEDCVIGVSVGSDLLVLNANKIIDKLVTADEMSREDAMEYFYYNIEGSKGKGFDAIYVMTEII
tara:strand:- start:177 stop:431 length:255 start_codon:yes stop_codon:yes gene_type:complete